MVFLKNSCWMLKFHCCAYGQIAWFGMEVTDNGNASGAPPAVPKQVYPVGWPQLEPVIFA